MKFLPIACLLTTSLMASNAFAGSLYIGIDGDAAKPSSNTISGAGGTGNVEYKTSDGGDVELGYEPQALTSSSGDVRLEVQGGYHPFKLQDVVANGVDEGSHGNLRMETLMANTYFDMNTNTGLKPYVGAGVGDAYVDFAKNTGFGATDDNDNRLAYQFMAGVSYTLPTMPKVDWSLGYRYFTAQGPEYTTPTGDIKFDDLHASNIEAGIRYHFN